MKVSEIMTKNPITVKVSATVTEVAEKMEEENLGTVLVTDDNGNLKGIIVDRKIVTNVIAAGKDPSKTSAGDIMSAPVTVKPDTDIEEASKIIREKGFRRIPVVDNEKPVGIVSSADIVEHAKTCTACMTNILKEAVKAR